MVGTLKTDCIQGPGLHPIMFRLISKFHPITIPAPPKSMYYKRSMSIVSFSNKNRPSKF